MFNQRGNIKGCVKDCSKPKRVPLPNGPPIQVEPLGKNRLIPREFKRGS